MIEPLNISATAFRLLKTNELNYWRIACRRHANAGSDFDCLAEMARAIELSNEYAKHMHDGNKPRLPWLDLLTLVTACVGQD